jgi:mRNA-degrading endonuclease toxin of MazEF toxin-antitoxin module
VRRLELDFGRIVWADFIDPQGDYAGRHPCVVLFDRRTIAEKKAALVVVISTSIQRTPEEYLVRGLPQDGRTGLNKPGGIVCYWASLITIGELEQEKVYLGVIDKKLMQELATKIVAAKEAGMWKTTRRPTDADRSTQN